MSWRVKFWLFVIISLIVIAHVFLWRSDMDPTMKLVFTVINATGWSIVLGPIYLVHRWIKAVETDNANDGGT